MASVHRIAHLAQHFWIHLVLLEDSFAARLEFNRSFERGLSVNLVVGTFELLFYWVTRPIKDSALLHLPKHSAIKGCRESSHVRVVEVSYSCSAHLSQRLHLVDLNLSIERCVHLLKEQIGGAQR